ncbi:H/ACA ribonucleoprotein complex subunit 1 [Syngnathoides biaculeatus]|uniref:H/ACA ribonucleoprotein complex subunit 1 n=1 Tax=Syngnathoides biaculeatus TaxID=300417 RepID=UPI002ADE693A|nr:H/ACA ribonucleoprotein complex subunit 1 [Syngnathoides biaculeatus]
MSFRGGGGRGGGYNNRGGGGYNNRGGGGGYNNRGGGGGYNNRGSFGGRGGGRGGFRQQDYGPPEYVVDLGEFMHPCEDDIVCRCTTVENKVPYFNAPVYLENKEQVGKVDEIFGQLRDFYFSVKLSENMKASSFKKLQKFYIDPMKLLPLQRFLPRPPGVKGPPRGGRGGGRGRGSGGGRGGGFRGGRGGGGRGGGFGGGGRGGGFGGGGRGGGGGFRGRGGGGGRGFRGGK